jgi:uncharacterized protein (TIGR02217 family)
MALLVGVRLPEEIERGAIGGPRFNTSVLTLDSGFEKRNVNWIDTRGEWDLGYGLLDKFRDNPASVEIDLDQIISMFYVANGMANSFRFMDFADFEIGMENGVDIDAQAIGFGDDVLTTFQVFKRYSFPGAVVTHDRFLTKLVGSTVRVYLEGVLQTLTTHYTVDEDRGTILMVTAPASTGGSGPGGTEILSIRTEYDNHVRFNTDALDINMQIYNAGSWPTFPIIELRENGLD